MSGVWGLVGFVHEGPPPHAPQALYVCVRRWFEAVVSLIIFVVFLSSACCVQVAVLEGRWIQAAAAVLKGRWIQAAAAVFKGRWIQAAAAVLKGRWIQDAAAVLEGRW